MRGDAVEHAKEMAQVRVAVATQIEANEQRANMSRAQVIAQAEVKAEIPMKMYCLIGNTKAPQYDSGCLAKREQALRDAGLLEE